MRSHLHFSGRKVAAARRSLCAVATAALAILLPCASARASCTTCTCGDATFFINDARLLEYGVQDEKVAARVALVWQP